jgi:hypothetical protein
MMPPIYELLFELQQVLLNSIAPQLRAVAVDVDTKKNELFFFFFYDGEVSDELFELASIAVTEVEMYPSQYFRYQHIIRLDFPEKIPIQGRLAFLRKEPNLPEYKKESRTFLLKQTSPIIVLLLDMQEALLGKITPDLRYVTVGVDLEQKQLKFYFIYDGEISEEDHLLATLAIQEASVSFPGYQVDSHIERNDFPNKMFAEGMRAAYLREEIKFLN